MGSGILREIHSMQLSLFKRQTFPVPPQPSLVPVKEPRADATITSTVPAYYAYLQSGGYSQYTPKLFVSDVNALGQFLQGKKLLEITPTDIREWVSKLKASSKHYTAKTISRKLCAINNYFVWLQQETILEANPVQAVRNYRITSPLPDILFESECQQLLTSARADPRLYLLVLLLLETGIKKEELFALKLQHVDLSNKYAPEVWIKHEGKKVKKDRKLKLPAEIVPVFQEYTATYHITDRLFPYSLRFLQYCLTDSAQKAGIHKAVTASILRDTFAVRALKAGESMENVLTKLGLSPTTWEDAKVKYEKLASSGL